MELIDTFYNSLRRSLVGAQGMRTSFESLKAKITRAIENIKDIGGVGQIRPLERLVESFEKDKRVALPKSL